MLSLLTGSVSLAQAQTTSFGIKAGASLTNVTGDGVGSNVKNLFGFHGGLFANFALNDAFSIQPEVLYSMKGTKSEGPLGGYSGELTSRLHYIDVPVLARVNAGGLFFELGPQIGFLVAAKQKQEISGGQSAGTFEDDLKNRVRTIDFGYAAGLGYQLSNGPGIGLRYNGGFIDTKSPSSSAAVRNSAFQLYLTYSFGGK
ncbi:PorT family protein [Hymenobacter setariae]|uniref:PorT family protein n=1 Tax=Hymenobacter setariae TaxID=2594794 RepID=A0A558BN51_9BACT|nr:porin family protein [Hymenobacter setariae]TVT37935.1 PorT family protein [Hymenobacter setariae]